MSKAEDDARFRKALARAIQGGYVDESIDRELYANDPIYHAIVWEIRKHRSKYEALDKLAAEKMEEALG